MSKLIWLKKASVLILGGIASASLLVACAQKDMSITPHALTESYSLLDQGRNDSAIVLLEQTLQQDPDGPHNGEARFLLSTAYLGKAGINVYSLHDSFHDVIFAKSLDESFWGKDKQGIEGENVLRDEAAALEAARKSQLLEQTPAALLIDRTDYALVQLRKAIIFLNRFPDVPEKKWVLLDRALNQLEQLPPEKDIALYRAFIRVIYARAFLAERVLKGQEFGTRSWACQAQLGQLHDDLIFISQQVALASEDVVRVFPDKASSLARVQGVIQGMLDELNRPQDEAPAGSRQGLALLQTRMRASFSCSELSPTAAAADSSGSVEQESSAHFEEFSE